MLTRAFDVMPDGRLVGLLSGEVASGSGSSEIRVVLNWLDQLNRRVPIKERTRSNLRSRFYD